MGGGPSLPISKLSRDRVIVVTGSSNGIGYEIAKWCAMMGATVVMACRSEERTMKCIERMNEEFRAEKAKGTVGLTDAETLALEYMHVDMASFKSVVSFTENYKRSGKKLHVLFHNAGVGFIPFNKTEDGYETALQVNYLSAFLMTAKLLPVLKASGDDCRILMMCSGAYNMAAFDLETLNYSGPPDKFPLMQYYGRSKMYQVYQMYAMVRRLQGTNITVNCLDPGIVESNFPMPPGCFGCCLSCIRGCCATKTYDGSKCSIDCATNPKHKGTTGLFYNNFKIKATKDITKNQQDQEKLWEMTFNMIKDFVTEQDRAEMDGRSTEQAVKFNRFRQKKKNYLCCCQVEIRNVLWHDYIKARLHSGCFHQARF